MQNNKRDCNDGAVHHRSDAIGGRKLGLSTAISAATAIAVTLVTQLASAQSTQGFDFPYDHPLEVNAPIVGIHDTTYSTDVLSWTTVPRVLAIQSLGKNWDLIVENNGFTYPSQNQAVDDIDFVFFDGVKYAQGATTATVYHNGDPGGVFYAYYVQAAPFDEWDGEEGFAEFNLNYFELVKAKTLYLKAGVAYRFDIDRADGNQRGFASLMRSGAFDTTQPRSESGRTIQPRSQAVAEFSWDGPNHDDFVYVPEEGDYTLVVVQTNGSAVALAAVSNTEVIPRGTTRVNDNAVRINVTAE